MIPQVGFVIRVTRVFRFGKNFARIWSLINALVINLVPPPTREDLNRVNMVTDDLGFVSGNKGTLLRTEDGGTTWQKVPLRTSESLFGISFIDKKTGWIVGYNGIIVRTYDAGHKWVEQINPTSADLFAVSFNKNRGFAIGRDGLLVRYYEKR